MFNFDCFLASDKEMSQILTLFTDYISVTIYLSASTNSTLAMTTKTLAYTTTEWVTTTIIPKGKSFSV